MKNILVIIVLTSLFLGCSNLKKIEKVTSGKVPSGLSAKQIEAAVIEGGAVKGWVVKSTNTANNLEGSLRVRSHLVEVEIPYNQESFEIIYKNSENMDFDKAAGKIHRNYFRWVFNLKQAIEIKLALKANE